MGTLDEIMRSRPFLQEEIEPLAPVETVLPIVNPAETVSRIEIGERAGKNLLRTPPPGALTERMMNMPTFESRWQDENLSAMDYLEDTTLEFLAGVVEGATLENIEFGEVGTDTSVGDIARTVGSFGGSVLSYSAIAALLGHLGVFAGALSVPMVMGRAGLTAFTARLLTDIDEPEEDVIDRIQESLVSGALGASVSTIPFVFDKAVLKFNGGPQQYMETLKGRLGNRLIKDFGFSPTGAGQAVREFEAEVARQVGAKSLNAAALKRVAKGQETAKKFLSTQRGVHALAKGKKGLGLSVEEFHRTNISTVGEAHTNRMSPSELRRVLDAYKDMFRRFKEAGGENPDYLTMRKTYTGFEPGWFSGHRPVERIMRQMGFQKLYDRVYDAKIQSIGEQRGYDMVRRELGKRVSSSQKKAIFKMMDTVEVPVFDPVTGLELSDDAISAIYSSSAGTFGVDAKNVQVASWIRSTSRGLLKRMNAVLVSEGKEPITERAAYITHLLQDTGTSLGGITPEIWAALKLKKGTSGASRFLQRRLGAGDILEDPFRAHSAYTKAALKMIHLAPAKDHVLRKLSTGTTLRNGKKVSLELPRNTRKYIDDWLNHGVMEVTTDTDKLLNTTLGTSAKQIAAKIKMSGYLGTLWGNPVSVLRNTTQQTLNVARLGKYWVDGIRSFNPKKQFMDGLNGWQFAEKHSKLLTGRAPALEGLDPTTMGKFVQLGFSPFRLVDKSNIVAGFNGSVKKSLAEGKSFNEAVKLADRLVRDTQFNYLNIDTPLHWLSTPGKLASQFQSWWTRYLEEVWSWGGTMPVGDGTGRTIKYAKQAFNVAKSKEMARYLMINSTILYGLHKAGLPLRTLSVPIPFVSSGPMPTGIPPAVSGLLGMGEYAYGTLIGDERIRASGAFRVKRQLPIHTVPGYVTLRKAAKVTGVARQLHEQGGVVADVADFAGLTPGELPVKAMVFPVSEKEYKEQMNSWLE